MLKHPVRHGSGRHPDLAEATIRFAIRKIRYSAPKGNVEIVEISRILDLRTNPTNATAQPLHRLVSHRHLVQRYCRS